MPNIDPLDKSDFNRYVDRHDNAHGALDARIARDMVPLTLYMADQRANERRMTELERDLADRPTKAEFVVMGNRLSSVEGRPASMRNTLFTVAGLVLALLGVVVTAYFSARGGT
jgi:hypothetical protein